MSSDETFAKKLKKWRGQRYQKEAADFLRIPLRTYQAWESQANEPSQPTQCEIERRMNEHRS